MRCEGLPSVHVGRLPSLMYSTEALDGYGEGLYPLTSHRHLTKLVLAVIIASARNASIP